METLRLFNAVPIPDDMTAVHDSDPVKSHMATAPHGFILSPEVLQYYSCRELLPKITANVGIGGAQANSSFHKSWHKVAEADIEQLVMEQMVHYLTTYGFEQLGIYSSDSIYIPAERLDIPTIELDRIRLSVIHGLTKAEIKDKLLFLLSSGIALKDETLTDVVSLAVTLDFTEKDLEQVKNKEARAILHIATGVCPSNPTEFLRLMVYEACGKSLLIKSTKAIEEIKQGYKLGIQLHFQHYEKAHGLERLAEIFNRFKPIFLAFRYNTKLKQIINRIRRLARTHHKPMPIDLLNSVTELLRKGQTLPIQEIKEALKTVNIFRKIRLAYALNYRIGDAHSILYKVRNGKAYATDFVFNNQHGAEQVLVLVLASIAESMQQTVNGKKIFIPEFMNYALPATEKQFTGHFPSGTHVVVPNDMMVGVNWHDVYRRRIDLDLSALSISGKVGWDSRYRDSDSNVLFSGDVTAAPQGATELLYVKKQSSSEQLITLNYYNHNEDVPVPFTIFVAHEKTKAMRKNHTVDPNNILAVAHATMVHKQKVLGLLITDKESSRFYFCEADLGQKITSSSTPFTSHARQYMREFYSRPIDLRNLLVAAGAELVDSPEGADMDLSPELLQKDSFINLLRTP